MDAEIKKYYSPQELAEEIEAGISTIYDLLRRGLVPHTKLGARYIIPGTFVAQLRTGEQAGLQNAS